jgi:hypothetical protein
MISSQIKFKRNWVEQVVRDKRCRHHRRRSRVATAARHRVTQGPSVETRQMDHGVAGVLKGWWAMGRRVSQAGLAR